MRDEHAGRAEDYDAVRFRGNYTDLGEQEEMRRDREQEREREKEEGMGGFQFGESDDLPAPTTAEKQDEKVHHPSHYGGDTTYEVIKVIDAWGLNFNLGNVLKYVFRSTQREDADIAGLDLAKARWYLQNEIGQDRSEP